MSPEHPKLFPPIPTDTDHAARFVFTSGNFYLAIGNHANRLFGGLFLDDPFGWIQEAEHMAMLYLITIFQFVETLADQEAAEALRMRVDWKYALHLPLDYYGLPATNFCEFRRWLLGDQAGHKNMQILLTRMSEITMAPRKRDLCRQPDTIVNKVCLQNRLVMVWQAFRDTISALAISNPGWLRTVALPNWYARYSRYNRRLSIDDESLNHEDLAQAIGQDGDHLLKTIAEVNLPGLNSLPEVVRLQQVWQMQYVYDGGKITWKKEGCLGCLPIPTTSSDLLGSRSKNDRRAN